MCTIVQKRKEDEQEEDDMGYKPRKNTVLSHIITRNEKKSLGQSQVQSRLRVSNLSLSKNLASMMLPLKSLPWRAFTACQLSY